MKTYIVKFDPHTADISRYDMLAFTSQFSGGWGTITRYEYSVEPITPLEDLEAEIVAGIERGPSAEIQQLGVMISTPSGQIVFEYHTSGNHHHDHPVPSIESDLDQIPDEVIIENAAYEDLFHFSGLRRPGDIPIQDRKRFLFCKNASPFYQLLLKTLNPDPLPNAETKKKTKTIANAVTPAEQLKEIATKYIAGDEIDGQKYGDFPALAESLLGLSLPLIELYEHLLHQDPSQADDIWEKWLQDLAILAVNDPQLGIPILEDLVIQLSNGILAMMIVFQPATENEADGIELQELFILALRLSTFYLRLVKSKDERTEEVNAALKGIVIVPQEIFKVLFPIPTTANATEPYVRLLGIGTLLLVRSRLLGYSLGEVARIENVMRNEYRKKKSVSKKRSLEKEKNQSWQENDFLDQSDNAQTYDIDQETSVGEHTNEENFQYDPPTEGLKKSFADNSETLTGGWNITFSPNHNYQDQAFKYARSLSGKAIQARKSAQQKNRDRIVEKYFEEIDCRIIDNRAGETNLNGIYRWVNQKKRSELRTKGEKLILEFLIDTPAENYTQDTNQYLQAAPIAEDLLESISYTYITPEKYLELAAQLEIDHLIPIPLAQKTVSISLQSNPQRLNGELSIPEGYEAESAYLSFVFDGTKVEGSIGRQAFVFPTAAQTTEESTLPDPPPPIVLPDIPPIFPEAIQSGESNKINLNQETDLIPVSVLSDSDNYAVNIVINCELLPETLSNWQAKAYLQILKAYEAQKERLQTPSGQKMSASERKTIFREIRNKCIQVLISSIEDLNPWQQNDYVGFMKEAFAWEDMAYQFYTEDPFQDPGQTPNWADLLQDNDESPNFYGFLEAKAAKVSVAVRPEYLLSTLFSIWTQGFFWPGLRTDPILSDAYLFYVNHLYFDADHGDECKDKPIRTWDDLIPTQMLRLQESAQLPSENL
ncbi:MAG: hypothetical protein AB8H47_10855 [Bacteroidia bacterium]